MYQNLCSNLDSKCCNSPLSPLLVQYTMSTFLAPDAITLLQQDLLVAVAADVLSRESWPWVDRCAGIEG